MTRRLMLLCATLVALASEAAYGVGLGELELNSALNQRFDAEIMLTNVHNLEPEEILPNLASQEDFKRVGIERTYVLTDLRFAVQRDENGNLFINVTSSRPIIEPYLNFIVEVLWPSGRILREYTVLLDPPVFGQEGIEPIRPSSIARPARETARREEPQPRQQMREEPAPAPSRIRQQPEEPRLADEGRYRDGEYGMTGPGDTMWAIALKVRPDNSVSVQQTMLAIQRANPDAFINNNINLLKAGHVLRIPDGQEIRELTRENAIAEVKLQNEEFDLYKSGADVAQLDATRRQREPVADSGEETGELKLLTSGEASGERAGSGGGTQRMAELEADLAVAKEDLDRTNRANTELNSRIADLEGQVEDLSALIEAKDNQLATLQDQLRKMLEQQPAQQPSPQPVQRATADSLLANPFVLGGLGLLLIGGLAGGLIFMRKRQQSATLDDDDFSDMTVEEDVDDVSEDTDGESTLEIDAEEIDEELAPQTSDAISEAEIYIAYGRFPQAITFLQNAIEAEPERADLHLKLMEVYVETEDATAFNLQFERLKALGDEEATARGAELQRQIPGAAESAEAAMDATVVSSEPVTAIEEPADDDDLSFDLDDLDSETEDEDLNLGDDLDLDDDSEDLDLDLDLDLDDDDDSGADLATADSDDDLDLNLDDDLELDDVELDLDDTVEASADDTTELNLEDLDSDDDSLDLGDLDDDSDDDALDLGDLDDSDDDDALDLSALDDSDDDDALDLSDLDDSDDDDVLDLSDLDDGDDDDVLDLSDLDDDDDDALDLSDLDDDDSEFDLGDLDDDDDALDLSDAEGLDDDDLELDLDEDAGTKLDLARAYIDMGDKDGARNVLEEVLKEGSETEVKEANELLEKID